MIERPLRAVADEPERGTDLLGAIEYHLRDLCDLLGESSLEDDTRPSRADLQVLVIGAEAIRLTVAHDLPYHDAYAEACDRFDDPDRGVARAEEYLRAFARRAGERRR